MTTNQQSNTPYNSIVDITPDLAGKWLEGNTHNRPLTQAVAERFARDIQANRWRLTHQGIAFDKSGVLIDGQHRLWAVVLSGITVPMRVFFNEPLENMEAVDTGTIRTNLHVLDLTGQAGEVTSHHLATLRALIAGYASCTPRMTVGEEAELLVKHRSAVDFAIKHLGGSHFKGVATALTRSVVARAYYSVDHARLIRFCDVLKSGTATDQEDNPIALLWQFLVGAAPTSNARGMRRIRYAKIERALLAFLRREQISCLRAMDSELFPLPEEIARGAAA